ncbi:MAG: hypothetical protein A2915_03940 [Candidatus Yanofskybacteria bacterium RIFCSPLOWO2_01_FULL_41_34]|uniref:Thymidylate kinase n=1 Tax=Candidatus Yanofskybacteria bacterium RIFCSPHIGHO2_01_FULL_41_26 TaxID=1802661 RepID=A0A1F8EBX1_9BACT|nr:MAG: hypothetical protein A2649_03035 [Candidatus Yanofskybacteria bacterium RIFCSPHIGHO2_01_FULL_41_26]OGN21561.1 MAG: hypothetical protein A2915_03940 [Candidatus Yanofskybacteria bacterium RIFCSPLOWO2_01_FULL_41_34]
MSSGQSGKLVVIEGADGCGKTIATDLIAKRLRGCGFRVIQRDFPSYGQPPEGNPASYFVRKHLRKKEFGFEQGYGSSTEIDPRIASQFYALERYDAAFSEEPKDKPNLWDSLRSGNIVISNRYVESNLGHQGAKIRDQDERKAFMKWAVEQEYCFYKIPRPDLVILLDVDSDLALNTKRKQRKLQGIAMDGYEVNDDFMRDSKNSYLEAANLFKEYWETVRVWATDSDGKIVFRDPKEINQDIWRLLIQHGIIR